MTCHLTSACAKINQPASPCQLASQARVYGSVHRDSAGVRRVMIPRSRPGWDEAGARGAGTGGKGSEEDRGFHMGDGGGVELRNLWHAAARCSSGSQWAARCALALPKSPLPPLHSRLLSSPCSGQTSCRLVDMYGADSCPEDGHGALARDHTAGSSGLTSSIFLSGITCSVP